MYKVIKYHRGINHDIVKTKAIDIMLKGKQDIYKEGDSIDILNLTEIKTVSVDKILKSNNSLKMGKRNTLIIYSNTNKRRALKKIGNDNSNRYVLKFNDCWIRVSERLFNILSLNYLHSIDKELKELIKINVDNYRVVINSTRYGYPDITLYEKGQG